MRRAKGVAKTRSPECAAGAAATGAAGAVAAGVAAGVAVAAVAVAAAAAGAGFWETSTSATSFLPVVMSGDEEQQARESYERVMVPEKHELKHYLKEIHRALKNNA